MGILEIGARQHAGYAGLQRCQAVESAQEYFTRTGTDVRTEPLGETCHSPFTRHGLIEIVPVRESNQGSPASLGRCGGKVRGQVLLELGSRRREVGIRKLLKLARARERRLSARGQDKPRDDSEKAGALHVLDATPESRNFYRAEREEPSKFPVRTSQRTTAACSLFELRRSIERQCCRRGSAFRVKRGTYSTMDCRGLRGRASGCRFPGLGRFGDTSGRTRGERGSPRAGSGRRRLWIPAPR